VNKLKSNKKLTLIDRGKTTLSNQNTVFVVGYRTQCSDWLFIGVGVLVVGYRTQCSDWLFIGVGVLIVGYRTQCSDWLFIGVGARKSYSNI
jgi:hypothetical protein